MPKIVVAVGSCLWGVISDDNCSFYNEAREIYDIIHADTTALINNEDILPTYLIPYHLSKSLSKKRFFSRDTLQRKHSSSFSVDFDTVKNQ